jgi:hypothetical protein
MEHVNHQITVHVEMDIRVSTVNSLLVLESMKHPTRYVLDMEHVYLPIPAIVMQDMVVNFAILKQRN